MDIFRKVCIKIKNDVDNDIAKNKINSAIRKIVALSNIENLSVNFKDERLENSIQKISSRLFPVYQEYIPVRDNVVFCDSMMWDNHGLTQQYLRALFSLKVNILYIKTGTVLHPNADIENEIHSYRKCRIVKIANNKDYESHAKLIYNEIIKFQPERIFMHSFSVPEMIALCSIKSSIRYRINLGNHLSWLGLACTDYMFDFNNWGYSISVQKRGFSKGKIFKLPFYPIVNQTEFKGFPMLHNPNKVIVYSGGALYKIKDKSNTFLNIVKQLINTHENLYVYFSAREKDTYIREFIEKNKLNSRFILLGYRNDVNEVFKHIDIFLQTYPIGGGLMEKYAMMNRIPILSYVTEDKLSQYSMIDDEPFDGYGSYKKAYVNMEDFYNEANKLIKSKIYRESIGEVLYAKLTNEQVFNEEFSFIYYNHINRKYQNVEQCIDYEMLNVKYEDSRKTLEISYLLSIISVYRFKILFKFPNLLIRKIGLIINYIANKSKRLKMTY